MNHARLYLLSAIVGMFGVVACSHTDRNPPPAGGIVDEAAAAALEAPVPGPTLAQWAQGAQLFDNLGTHTRKISTTSDEAQAYFNQGLRLIYAFNHDEAVRAFAKAAQFDPGCAMCYWGAGEALGPNYNMPAMSERWVVLWESVQSARHNVARATPVEQALIAALAKRYKGPESLSPEAMKPLNVAYADTMRAVAKQFPDDDDVQVFFAEAMMTANAWKLWAQDGKAAPGTDEIVATLETVLARDPLHPGANHYYIHTIEASPHPEKALAAAKRMAGLIPGAGHIVHMPSHIFQRVGHYAEASAANRAAVSVDQTYINKAKPPAWSYYAGMYLAHNYQFLAYSAAMQGRAAEALQATRDMRAIIPDAVLHMGMGLDWYAAEGYFVMERFGRWNELLVEPAPDPALIGLTAAYRYARTAAFAATGHIDAAVAESEKLDAIAAATPADAAAGLNSARDVIRIATLMASARIAATQGKTDTALANLREAVTRQDALSYDEPADWFWPVRHLLGAQLLKAGKAAEAESVYREDLRRNPDNGWSLYGLAQALQSQHRTGEAIASRRQFERAWKDADVGLTASAYY